jgi:hypothetical protein
MRYCPYCHRINAGTPQICNYCGHSWHIRLCPRGHENLYDARFCGICGSTDLTDTVGPRRWWSYLIRALILICIILIIFFLGRGAKKFSPVFINYVICIALLLFGYYLVIAIAPQPIKGMLRYMNKVIVGVALGILTWLWRAVRVIIFDNKNINSRGK